MYKNNIVSLIRRKYFNHSGVNACLQWHELIDTQLPAISKTALCIYWRQNVQQKLFIELLATPKIFYKISFFTDPVKFDEIGKSEVQHD